MSIYIRYKTQTSFAKFDSFCWPSNSSMSNLVYLGVKTCEVFLCFVAIVRGRPIMLNSLLSLFDVIGECHRFLHRG